jgi:aminoglycoside phosphotransferase (APT) family kinase protein
VPELAAVPDDLGAVFVAEKIVAAKELPAGFPDDRLASWLMEFYAGNGLRPEALQDHLQLDQAWPAITELCRERNLRIPAQLSAWVDKAEDTAGAVLCAPCNGDLTQTNLLVDGERLCIIDWEYLNHGPVCRDVIRLSTQRRGFSWHWLRELEAVSASHEANLLSPRDQFIAATIMVIMERIQREHEFSDPASRRAYRERMKGRIAKILALSERVLDADQ